MAPAVVAETLDHEGSTFVLAQSYSNFAPGQAWTDSRSPQQNSSNQAGAVPQAYSPPSGGYSAPFQYSSPFSAPANNGIMPSFQSQGSAPGLLSSRVQPPLLPEGLVLPIQLDTSIDTDKAEEGDPAQAHITQNISSSGAAYLPGGSSFSGTIVKVPEEGHFGKSGKLSIDFTQVRLPNGRLIPMKGHLVGRIGTYIYRPDGSSTHHFLSSAWKYGLGATVGRGLGTMMSVGSGSGYGPGSGAYTGGFFAGGSSIMNALFLRHGGHDTFLHPGTRMELQLEEPLELPGLNENRQYLPGSGPNTGIFILLPVLDKDPSIGDLIQYKKQELKKNRRRSA